MTNQAPASSIVPATVAKAPGVGFCPTCPAYVPDPAQMNRAGHCHAVPKTPFAILIPQAVSRIMAPGGQKGVNIPLQIVSSFTPVDGTDWCVHHPERQAWFMRLCEAAAQRAETAQKAANDAAPGAQTEG